MSRSALAPGFALVVLLAGAAAGAAVRILGSVEEFAEAVGMKPGGWQVTMKPVAARIEATPGADPANVAALKAEIEPQIGTVEVVDECMSPASAGSVRLPGILVERGCSYSRLEAGGGRWAMAATCPAPGKDGTVTLAGEGTYSSGLVTGRHEARIPIRGLVAHVTAETVSRFVGECSPQAPPVPVTVTPPKN